MGKTATAMFTDVEALAQFCAVLLREGVEFEVRPGQAAGYYEVLMYPTEAK